MWAEGGAAWGVGAGSAQAATKKDKTVATASKTVLISIRLPAELASRTRERAMDQEGGINAVVTQALELWLAGSNPGSEDSTQGST